MLRRVRYPIDHCQGRAQYSIVITREQPIDRTGGFGAPDRLRRAQQIDQLLKIDRIFAAQIQPRGDALHISQRQIGQPIRPADKRFNRMRSSARADRSSMPQRAIDLL